MNGEAVLARLAQDKPLFHFIPEAAVSRVSGLGAKASSGEVSYAVSPGVLEWLAGHVSEEMVTLETGAGYTTVLLSAIARRHYCCTHSQREADKILAYLKRVGIAGSGLVFLIGSSDESLARLSPDTIVDFAYIDGCHGYPFPALDWHYIDKHLRIGGVIGMDDWQLRPVREHCEFLEENGTYSLIGGVSERLNVRFYTKQRDEGREWTEQAYSRAKRYPRHPGRLTRVKLGASRWLRVHLP